MAVSKKDWFRPKRYGYGAEPSNWKGWAMTLGYVVLVIAITFPLLGMTGISEGQPASGNLVIWGVLLAALTLAFVLLCWVKTDGDWRWRWGKRD